MKPYELGVALQNLRPNSSYAVDEPYEYANIRWLDETQTKPTEQEVNDAYIAACDEVALSDCKKQASALLYETDWTTIPDVANPANTPYLMNQADFIAYRNQVRQLAVNPVVNPVFPTKPTEQWSQA